MKKKFQNQVYQKFVRNLFAVLIVPILILFVNYVMTNRTLNQQLYQENVRNLENGAQNLDNVLENMERILIYFSDDTDIVNFFYQTNVLKDGSTTSNLTHARTSLQSVATGNSAILNIQLYEEESESLIDFFTPTFYLERYYGNSFQVQSLSLEEWKAQYLQTTEDTTFQKAVMTVSGQTREVFVYNRRFTKFRYKNTNNRVIFYVDTAAVLQCFDTASYSEGGHVLLLDAEGSLLLDSTGGQIEASELEMLRETENTGYRIAVVNGQRQLITSYTDDARGWVYYAMIPVANVLEATSGMKHFMQALLLLCIILGVLLVIFMANRLSEPLTQVWDLVSSEEKELPFEDFIDEMKRIVNDNEELRQETQKQIPAMRTAAFYQLMLGEEEAEEEYRRRLGLLEIRQDAASYCVLVLVCNNSGAEFAVEEITAQKLFIDSAVREYAQEALQGIYQVDYERMTVILAYDLTKEEAARRTEEIVGQVLLRFHQNINFSISIGGEVLDDVRKLSEGVQHAQFALNVSKNIFGASPIQWFWVALHEGNAVGNDSLPVAESKPQRGRGQEESSAGIGEQMKLYVDTHYTDPEISLTSIAEAFHFTEVYVSKIFKKEIGQNFSKYIEALRITHAKQLIEQGAKVQEAAFAVGYHSPQVFRRAWKRYFENTPGEMNEEESHARTDQINT